MKSVKELNKIADAANKSVLKTVNAFIDPQSFIESDKFVRSITAFGDAVGEGVVCGFATVDDTPVSVYAINGETLKGGIGSANAVKIAKCVANANATGNVLVGIIDTAGARFGEGIDALEGYSAIVSAYANANVFKILVIKGNNFGMLSYLCGLSDVVICYDKSVTATSSPLILASANKVDEKSVGTSEEMAKGGVSSLTVKNDAEMAKAVKSLVNVFSDRIIASEDDGNRVCRGLKVGVKTATAIAQIFDTGSFIELKKEYGEEVSVGFARLNGIAVAVVAFNGDVKDGKLTAKGAKKVAYFINLADYMNFPVINLVDCSGSANCVKCQGALITDIAEVINSYATAEVAKISLITGNAIGLGYVGFASKSVFDYTIAWEGATIGLTTDEAMARLIYADQIAQAEDKDAVVNELANAYGAENTTATVVAESGYVDNVINPNFSRQYLIGALQAFLNK